MRFWLICWTGMILAGAVASAGWGVPVTEVDGPAEAPPEGYAERQYVDSQGCIFVRVTGAEGLLAWAPVATPEGELLCGHKPSITMNLHVGAPQAEPPAPAETAPSAEATPEPLPEPAATAPEPSSETAPEPAGEPAAAPEPAGALAAPAAPQPRTPAPGAEASTAPAPVAPEPAAPKAAPTPAPGATASRQPVRLLAIATVSSSMTDCAGGASAEAEVYVLSDGRRPVNCAGPAADPLAVLVAGDYLTAAGAAPEPPSGARYLQLGAFAKAGNAARIAALAMRLGYAVELQPGRIGTVAVTQVMAGPFAAPSDLRAAWRAFHTAGLGDAYYR